MPRKQREIPWLDQRPNGQYYVCRYDAGRARTERLSLRTRDPQEAQDRYVAFLTEGRALTRRPAAAGLTVAEALDHYLTEHVRRNVVATQRQEIAIRHLRAYFGDTPLRDVDKAASRAYRAHRAACNPPAGPTTVRRELTALVAAANHEASEKRLPRDQLPVVELPPHAPPDEAKFFTKPELRALLAEVSKDPDPRLRAFVVLAYVTGARRKSIERLKKDQIDIEKLRLRLTPEGRRETKKRAPVVRITPEMLTEIGKLLLWSGPSEYLFRDPGYDVYKKLRAAAEACGFADRTGPHVLRHTRATHMLQDGASVWTVAKLLGDTIETVERVYGHHCPDYLAEQETFKDLGVLG